MLKHLYISNFALIDRMDLEFSPGMNVITGETGAGKSIMINGLSLVLGKRADMQWIRNKDKKLIVEATFAFTNDDLKPLFETLDVDYEQETIVRREILPSGKSRAFVNDMPVRLEILQSLAPHLVDIHSQHQTLLLKQKSFLYRLLDAYAGTEKLLNEYRDYKSQYSKFYKKWQALRDEYTRLKNSADFRTYQLQELRMLDWDTDWEEAEQKLKQWHNRENILATLSETKELLEGEPYGVLEFMRKILLNLSTLSSSDKQFSALAGTAESVMSSLNELSYDLERIKDVYDLMDTDEKVRLEEQLDRLFTLMKKHNVLTPEELRQIKEKMEAETHDFEQMEDAIRQAEKSMLEAKTKAEETARKLFETRKKAIPGLIKSLESILQALEMKNTRLKIELQFTDEMQEYGMDRMQFLISSDKGQSFGEVDKIASGGELSRLMLAIKSVMARKRQLPTIVFDEIDAGISGEVARKTAELIWEMAQKMQVIVITHLPQMAVKGQKHFKVFKEEKSGQIISSVKELLPAERIHEIAEMIEGKPPSESAIKHARFLLEEK